MSCKYENKDEIIFKIDYNTEIVKFINGTIKDKDSMFIREFANDVLGIEIINKELFALYIAKVSTEFYNKTNNKYIIKRIKSKKNYFEGIIKRV